MDVLSRIPSKEKFKGLPKKTAGSIAGTALGKPLRKGKDPTESRDFKFDAGSSRKLDTNKLHSSPESTEIKEVQREAFIAAEAVCLNIINNEINSLDAKIKAAKKDGDGAILDAIQADTVQSALLKMSELSRVTELQDEEFTQRCRENPALYDFSNTDANNPPLEVLLGEELVEITRIVGKVGDKFICETKDKNGVPLATTTEINSKDVILGQLTAYASQIRETDAFNGSQKKEVFDAYIASLTGDLSKLPESPEDQKAFMDKISIAAGEQGIPRIKEDIFVAINNMTGYHKDGPPDAHASQDEWNRYNRRQRLRDPFEKMVEHGKVIVTEPSKLNSIFWEDLSSNIDEQRQKVAQLRQLVASNLAPQEDLDRATLELGAMQLADKNRSGLDNYFSGIITGDIPPDQAREILKTVRDADSSSTINLLPQISEFVATNEEDRQAWIDRAKKVDKRRQFALGSLGLLMVLAYMAQSQVLGGMNE